MILQELMLEHQKLYTLTENGRIIEAVQMMREHRIGSIVIVNDVGTVSGIITDRDIAMALAFGSASPESYVTETMSREVEVINEELTLFDVTRFFRTSNVKRLPVVDREGIPVGIVSLDDVMAVLAREMFDTCTSLVPKLGHMV